MKDSFSFVGEVPSFDCTHYITSFNIQSLFTNIKLEKSVKICVDKDFKNKMKNKNINES